jgi:long-chain acyl-CoA synthetase
MRNETLIALFEESVRRFPGNTLLLEKRDAAYAGTTYSQVYDVVQMFAAGLLSLGINAGDRIALLAEGRNDWVIAELGILCAGGINVPLSVKLQEGPDLVFRLDHSECRMIVASGSQLAKVRAARKDVPAIQTVVLLDPADGRLGGELLLEELYLLGRDFLRTRANELADRKRQVKENDPATICYTSGTTADPKGVILTHRNYTANVAQSSAIISVPEWYSSLLILPWDHCFAHTAGIYTLMRNGASMSSVQSGRTALETIKNIPVNIRETRPVFLLSVPALARNFRKNIEAGVRQKGPVAGALLRAGLAVAIAYNAEGWNRGHGWRAFLFPLKVVFDSILFRKIRANFGGRLEFFIGGGALLDIDLQRFFYAIGIPMYQGYGLSEASPVISANTPSRHKLGSSGCLVPDLEVRICDDQGRQVQAGTQGEIVVRGENVMAGYYRNEKATRETIRDGWLHTGDLGYLDGDGYLYVLGRTKSLLIAADGEKYSPEGIEESLCSASKVFDQVLLFNDQSPYTVALVVPNKESVLRWMELHHLRPDAVEGQDAALRMLEKEIDAFRPGGHAGGVFPERWLPAAVAVLSEGFTEQNGMMNSTLKIVRAKIVERHLARLEYLFTPEGKNICNPRNREVLASWA